MKLNFEQIQAVSLGCARLEKENAAIRIYRMPDKLGAEYEPYEAHRIRRDCPVSVRLRFRSNSRSLKIHLLYGAASREIYQLACIVDGELILLGPSAVTASWNGEIPPLQKRAERLFELWLPSMVRTDIVSIELEDNASFAPAREHAFRWLAYGDSITQGMTVPNPAENHIALIARALNADVWNMGIGGGRMMAFLADTIPSFDYDIVTIAYGVNDFISNVPLSTYRENARNFFTSLLAHRPDSPVLAISPIPFLTDKKANTFGATLDDFHDALAAEASGFRNLIIADGRQLVPAEAGFFVDGCHPNAEGARVYAERLLPIMRSCLKPSQGQETHR
ncbi:MAG: GDSL-type esterase/lipase family protein [Kiritimatiellia bacterium]|nr:GDSL-type esterase/lipase family protein [Kiritimatiellia bacterium]